MLSASESVKLHRPHVLQNETTSHGILHTSCIPYMGGPQVGPLHENRNRYSQVPDP